MDKKARIEELVQRLNDASRAYYQEAAEIMPNIEYDALYDELLDLEKETGYVPEDSPSHNVGYEIVSKLPKEAHPSRMLSLNKTKSREELRDWLRGHEGLLSWKMDGLTIVLTYDGGKLVKALTRGNGDVGEVITNNAKEFENVPVEIPFQGHAVLRGEAVITYSHFDEINAGIPDADAKYKNPRNLCSGSVRQLDPKVTRGRHVFFMAFTLVEAEGVDFHEHRHEQMDWMTEQGFDVVPYKFVDPSNIIDTIQWYAEEIVTNDYPSDGLVLTFEDMAFGRSLGTTAKYPLDSMAFKWADTKEKTTLREIEWSASRTGLINPVAVFDPVELEGTTVTRASVHNVSIMEQLGLGIGDTITVYKANMIIPQIAEDLTPSANIEVPKVCPVCGGPTTLKDEEGVRTLYCLNPDCAAKQIKSFGLFVSRNAMDIDGLSESTIEKLVDVGLIKEFADLYRFEEYHDEFVQLEGLGEKSFEHLKEAIAAAKKRTPDRLLIALGVPGIGTANAKLIAKHFHNKWAAMRAATKEELLTIDGVGDVLAEAYVNYFADPKKQKIVDDLMQVLELEEVEEAGETFLEGLTFVITGSLQHYENRDALKAELEAAGAKTAGSVSSKTSYLINNDTTSTSGKNKKAQELGIPVIDEETIRNWLEKKQVPEA